MTYTELLEQARKNMDGYCLACPECNGAACKNKIPGPGGKGTGGVFRRNFEKLQEIKINLDTLYDGEPTDTSVELFGRTFRYPVFAAPIGAMKLHYGHLHDDLSYNAELVEGCCSAGIAAFTGDGIDPQVYGGALESIRNAGGVGIPTVKPWDVGLMKEKIRMAEAAGAIAVATDVDASGLALLKNVPTPVSPKTVTELGEVVASTRLPVVVKGIMTVRGALKALEAGAYGIVVSNHGGRVLDQTPATVEVLPEIAQAVQGRMKIFIDGGIRTGLDVFKVLALGADAALIGRPFVTAVYGGGAAGAVLYAEKVGGELAETMAMAGANRLSDIGRDMVWL
ncbi:alpha-hydroxy-acid oxidizing protein [Clostridiaceae bacterium NSJ-31]|uniref:L-lactate oxidase n=1 Tax=Ligaoa zhengdingensis TaxID=2763658 RepID=A0A926E0G1_9FIRM|nr:alpha-hydroxy-acid oxidizing protein [Ligaoa zhengdingensis]MBC8547333.1 alpha-hydroxy-acid oxidizing protein [Ligaoa zhengdingensis]